jgi:hypothetical protein
MPCKDVLNQDNEMIYLKATLNVADVSQSLVPQTVVCSCLACCVLARTKSRFANYAARLNFYQTCLRRQTHLVVRKNIDM